MPLFMKNKAAEHLARQAAGKTGESLVKAI